MLLGNSNIEVNKLSNLLPKNAKGKKKEPLAEDMVFR